MPTATAPTTPGPTRGLACWDVALTRRGGVPQWVTVRATNLGEAQIAALMLGLRRDGAAQWSVGRVRTSQASADVQATAPNYGIGLGRRLETALRAGRVVPDLDLNLDTAWYRMGPAAA